MFSYLDTLMNLQTQETLGDRAPRGGWNLSISLVTLPGNVRFKAGSGVEVYV